MQAESEASENERNRSVRETWGKTWIRMRRSGSVRPEHVSVSSLKCDVSSQQCWSETGLMCDVPVFAADVLGLPVLPGVARGDRVHQPAGLHVLQRLVHVSEHQLGERSQPLLGPASVWWANHRDSNDGKMSWNFWWSQKNDWKHFDPLLLHPVVELILNWIKRPKTNYLSQHLELLG